MKNDRITIRIPSSLLVEIDKEIKEKGTRMSDIIRESLAEHFRGKKKNEDVVDILKDIVKVLIEMEGSLRGISDSVCHVDSSLAEIRKFQILGP